MNHMNYQDEWRTTVSFLHRLKQGLDASPSVLQKVFGDSRESHDLSVIYTLLKRRNVVCFFTELNANYQKQLLLYFEREEREWGKGEEEGQQKEEGEVNEGEEEEEEKEEEKEEEEEHTTGGGRR
jgi:hypothetical protein